MIFRHQHLNEQFLKDKTILTVDESNPLVVVLSNKFTFLNQFITSSLNIFGVHFIVKQTDEQEIMSYHLPGIAFKDYFLCQQALIEFITDLMLERENFVNLNQRKNLIKDQYRKWFGVIKQEHTGLTRHYPSLSALGIHNEQDYFNHLFSQFLSMASWIKGDILERKYESYKRTQTNLETLFFYDVIRSVLKLCDKTQVDHILRAHFENLIEFTQSFAQKVEAIKMKKLQEPQFKNFSVVADKFQQIQEVQYPKFRLNWKRFTIVFTVAAAIYAKWVE